MVRCLREGDGICTSGLETSILLSNLALFYRLERRGRRRYTLRRANQRIDAHFGSFGWWVRGVLKGALGERERRSDRWEGLDKHAFTRLFVLLS